SVSCLDNEGFSFIIKNNKYSIYNKDMFYVNADLHDSLYVLNLKPYNGSIYNINSKKLITNDLNMTYLWHCILGHINEKCISKLHKDGFLDSFDFESFEKCKSCLLGKMTKDPFTGHSERAIDLLGLIHTVVCGPLNVATRGGYQYFITF